MQPNEIESRIFSALDRIASNTCLLEILSERSVWDGGIEKVFQGLFLWAFNGLDLSPCYYLAPEINLGSDIRILDFMVFKSSEAVDSKVNSAESNDELLEVASGFIEVKDIYNIYKGLSTDLAKLRAAAPRANRNVVGERFLYEMILLREWTREKLDAGWQKKAERRCWKDLNAQGVSESTCRIGAMLLFDNKHPVSDARIFTALSVLLVTVPADLTDG
jgi:hypothetical protein